MKKFEFTGEVMTRWDGTILHRIRALIEIDLGWKIIKAGEVGGWLEKEANLSQHGKCWVWGNAKVWGNAEVCGDAKVWGNAKVCGDAHVWKSEHVLVIGAIGSRDDFTTFMRNKRGEIKVRCGCFFGTVDEFLAKVKQTHGDSKYAVVYRAAVTLAIAQIDTAPAEEEIDG